MLVSTRGYPFYFKRWEWSFFNLFHLSWRQTQSSLFQKLGHLKARIQFAVAYERTSRSGFRDFLEPFKGLVQNRSKTVKWVQTSRNIAENPNIHINEHIYIYIYIHVYKVMYTYASIVSVDYYLSLIVKWLWLGPV